MEKNKDMGSKKYISTRFRSGKEQQSCQCLNALSEQVFAK